MLFNKFSAVNSEQALEYLVMADRTAVMVGKGAGLIALLGLIGTGMTLKFAGGDTLLPYPALRGLHWLFGLVFLIDCGCRLLRMVLRTSREFRKVRREGLYIRLPPALPALRLFAGAGYWIALWAVLISGLEALAAGRYGVSLLPGSPALAWSKIHGMMFYYLLGFLILRLFYWVREYGRHVRPYLFSP